jgi:hypothetical protein
MTASCGDRFTYEIEKSAEPPALAVAPARQETPRPRGFVGVDRYLLRFAVPPAEAAQWKAGRPIQWRPEGSSSEGESSFRAVVARVAPQVDLPSQMVFVEADLEPSPLLKDGLVVRVE